MSKNRMQQPFRELLKNCGTPLKTKTACAFLDTIEQVSPWFLDEGLLNIPQWEQLGEDLRIANGQQALPVGTLAIWSLVKSCLQQKERRSFKGPLEEGSQVLEELKEERSHQSEEKSDSEEELESEEELSGEELEEKVKKLGLKEECPLVPLTPSAPPMELMSKPSRQRGRHQGWSSLQGPTIYPVFEDGQQQRYHQPLDFKTVKQLKEAVSTYGPQSAFTVSLVETIGQQNLLPIDWTNLAKATLSGGQYLMWKTTWQELSFETARRNAASGNPQITIEMLMGTGPYEGVQAQLNYHPGVYAQAAAAAIRAWKTLQGTGDLHGQLSKVTQGSNEPYADFVDRLIQTASRIFGDADSAMPLIKQLAYEQANKWCKEAIRPWRSKDLSNYLRVCKDINETTGQSAAFVAALDRQTSAQMAAMERQTSAITAALAMGGQRGNGQKKGPPRSCFICGQMGHLKATCPLKPPQMGQGQAPGTCPRCQKGPHWANEC